jgi:hypothetical protein
LFFYSISPKDKSPPLGTKPTGATLQRVVTADDDSFARVKEPSDIAETKEQRPR